MDTQEPVKTEEAAKLQRTVGPWRIQDRTFNHAAAQLANEWEAEGYDVTITPVANVEGGWDYVLIGKKRPAPNPGDFILTALGLIAEERENPEADLPFCDRLERALAEFWA